MTEAKLKELQKECQELEKDNCEPFTFYRSGYEKAAREFIVKLADYLGMSLTFEDPIIAFDKLMEIIKVNKLRCSYNILSFTGH